MQIFSPIEFYRMVSLEFGRGAGPPPGGPYGHDGSARTSDLVTKPPLLTINLVEQGEDDLAVPGLEVEE